MRHTWRMGMVVVGAGLLLSGCFGSGSSEPAADHTNQPSSTGPTSSDTSSGEPQSPPTSTATSAPTSGSTSAAPVVLTADPPSNGQHSHTCFAITGTAPVDYVYYPVLIKVSAAATLDSATISYVDGVQEAGSWIAPATSQQGTGTVEGWPPPAILTQGNSVQWSKRVSASGASLDPAAGWYNVFLHLRVYPDQLPYRTTGITFKLHDSTGQQSVTWVDHVTYAAKC